MTNIFKGLDLVDRMPEEVWMEVCNIVQEAIIKTIPKKKKCKKAKWLSEEALQIAKERRDVKDRANKIQRITRREEDALFDEQCKETEETIEWERLEISSKNWRYQGNISCKDRHNKGQNQQGPSRGRRY